MRFSIPNLPELETNVSTSGLLANHVKPTMNISTAKYALVGEAASIMEIKDGEPFSGPAGNQLTRIMAAISMPKHQTYMTLSVKTSAPKGNINNIYTAKGFRCPEWGQLQRALIHELSQVSSKIIILSGDLPMRLILDHPKFDSITKYRGSIYKAEDFPHLAEPLKGKLLCICQNPKDTLANSNPVSFYILMGDLKKFMNLEADPSILDQPLTLHTAPRFDDAMDFLNLVKQQNETSFDIEATPKHITCFSLTAGASNAMSFPLLDNKGNYWDVKQEMLIWKELASILGNPNIGKITQNGMFDFMYTLRTMGIKTDGFFFDTMIAQHICWTDLPKGLDFLTSVYTHYPYYKDDGKLTHLKYIKDWPAYWQYNARDAAYTHLIVRPLMDELTKFNAWDTFNYTMHLHKPLMEMEYNGIHFNVKAAAEERIKLNKKAAALIKGINKIAKQDLNHNSSKQLISFFYGQCQIKPYINRKTGAPTCDAVALSRIAKANLFKKGLPGKAGAVARMIKKLRRITKLVSTYFDIAYDPDHRIRCAHKICGTFADRISTEQTFFGTGANLQNQPPAFKKFLEADPDTVMCEVDLQRAEAHVVAFLCQDHNMMEAFESGVDVHTYNAGQIFHVPMEQVSKTQRKLGKRVVHASNYGMGPQTFSDDLSKDDWFISMKECKELLNTYAAKFPGLKRWHKEIEDEVYRTRLLYTLFGRPKRFLGRLDSNTMRSAYSYKPQGTVAGLLNRGMIRIYNDKELEITGYKSLATVHDSTLPQIPLIKIEDKISIEESTNNIHFLLQRFKQHMSHTFYYKGREFTIGLDAKLGLRWSGGAIELTDFSQESVHSALTTLLLPR